jgi:hypothetical protein
MEMKESLELLYRDYILQENISSLSQTEQSGHCVQEDNDFLT